MVMRAGCVGGRGGGGGGKRGIARGIPAVVASAAGEAKWKGRHGIYAEKERLVGWEGEVEAQERNG
jgi:hypothetical protein